MSNSSPRRRSALTDAVDDMSLLRVGSRCRDESLVLPERGRLSPVASIRTRRAGLRTA
jgi:hypothetical protein